VGSNNKKVHILQKKCFGYQTFYQDIGTKIM